MKRINRVRQCWLVVVYLLLTGCAVTPIAPPASKTLVEPLLTRGVAPLTTVASLPVLNVNIAVFDLPESGKGRISRIYQPIREAEAIYLPVVLRDTLMASGLWGAVRIGPGPNDSSELQVEATVLVSTAIEQQLHVRATDARGHVWIDQVYAGAANTAVYQQESYGVQPFQDLYNRIANDLFRTLQLLAPADGEEIIRAAMLRYAFALSPEVFGRYLTTGADGLMVVTGLPAVTDRMYARVNRIRQSEYGFSDAMDEQFGRYYDRLQKVYPFWLQYSYELLAYNNQISEKPRRSRPGSWAATEDVYRAFREYKLNEDELRELSDSFRTEVEPTVAEFEGKVLDLSGPLSIQYQTWRRVLRELYAEERE
ncbi:MAG: hypothetical protein ACFHX7_22270 [Pseudomonadota bacterium]